MGMNPKDRMNVGTGSVYMAPAGMSVQVVQAQTLSGHSGVDWFRGRNIFGPEEVAAREALRLLAKMPVRDASTRDCRDRTVIKSTTYIAYGSIADDVREVFGARADTEVFVTDMHRTRDGYDAYVKCSLSVVCAGDLMTFSNNSYEQLQNMMDLLQWLDSSRRTKHVESGGSAALLDGFL
jgi:hypothetical protein